MIQTVLISIGTSLTVSLVTFILGLKSGKNQADRAFLQKLYKMVYCHFQEIELAIDEGRPKEWEDYKKIETMHSIKYYPIVKELKRTGDILYLKKRIAEKAISLEQECLAYSYEANKIIEGIHQCIVDNSQFFDGGVVFDSYRIKDDRSKAKTQNKEGCKIYHTESYFVFFDVAKLKCTLTQWMNSESKYALSFTTRGNPPYNSFTLYPGDLNINPDDFVNQIIDIIIEKNPEYCDMEEKQKKLKKQIRKMNKELQKRAQNPIGFWETFIGAFADLFH